MTTDRQPSKGSSPSQAGDPVLASGLYLVATPIGNLEDITLRALRILRTADHVVCEDTRHTGRLLHHYGIRNRLLSLHDHSPAHAVQKLLALLQEGKSLAVVSDAGSPLIADPGYPLVREARNLGIPVYAIPGPCALIAALSGSGLPTDSFLFLGFFPEKAKEKADLLQRVMRQQCTLAGYEAPHRLLSTLGTIATIDADRPVCVARELTKLHEETVTGPAHTVRDQFMQREKIQGECVVIIDRAPQQTWSAEQAEAALLTALETQPIKAAATEVAEMSGLPRRDLYQLALRLKRP